MKPLHVYKIYDRLESKYCGNSKQTWDTHAAAKNALHVLVRREQTEYSRYTVQKFQLSVPYQEEWYDPESREWRRVGDLQ